MTCTREAVYTPVTDVAVAENSSFAIEGYGSGNIFAYAIEEACLISAREDGKTYVADNFSMVENPDGDMEWELQEFRARNAEVAAQVSYDGYFLYTSYEWEPRNVSSTRAICFEAADVSDLYCWSVSLN